MRPVRLKRVWLLQFLLNMNLSNLPMEGRLTYSSAPDILQSSCQDILWSGCFVCWVYIQAGGRLEECRRASYKKTTLQIALSAFPLPLSWGKYCQRQSKVLTPPFSLPPLCWGKNSLLLQQPAVSMLYCGFLKGGSKLWCSVWSLSWSDFRYLAQLMENTGHLQKMIHPPEI